MQPTATPNDRAFTGSVLALDIGDRRIGVAIASAEARLPRPLETIDRQTTEPLARLKTLAQEHEVSRLVAGRPRDMNGNVTDQTRLAVSFAEEVGKELGLPVDLVDEAGTSLAATEQLDARGTPYDKTEVDRLAACIILQDWLVR